MTQAKTYGRLCRDRDGGAETRLERSVCAVQAVHDGGSALVGQSRILPRHHVRVVEVIREEVSRPCRERAIKAHGPCELRFP